MNIKPELEIKKMKGTPAFSLISTQWDSPGIFLKHLLSSFLSSNIIGGEDDHANTFGLSSAHPNCHPRTAKNILKPDTSDLFPLPAFCAGRGPRRGALISRHEFFKEGRTNNVWESIKICAIIILIFGLPPLVYAQTNAAPASPATISSDTLDGSFITHMVTYQGHVRVDDPTMHLRCGWLTATSPSSGGHIDHIVCETNVVIDAIQNGQTNHITSDKAVYDYSVEAGVTNEIITLTGNPKVENAQDTLTGDPMTWNRTTGEFTAVNEKIEHKMGASSFDGLNGLGGIAPTNTLAKPQ